MHVGGIWPFQNLELERYLEIKGGFDKANGLCVDCLGYRITRLLASEENTENSAIVNSRNGLGDEVMVVYTIIPSIRRLHL